MSHVTQNYDRIQPSVFNDMQIRNLILEPQRKSHQEHREMFLRNINLTDIAQVINK